MSHADCLTRLLFLLSSHPQTETVTSAFNLVVCVLSRFKDPHCCVDPLFLSGGTATESAQSERDTRDTGESFCCISALVCGTISCNRMGSQALDNDRRNKHPRLLTDPERDRVEEFVESIHYSARSVDGSSELPNVHVLTCVPTQVF